MKLAILGCAGSVGSRVVIRALKRGWKVQGVDSVASLPSGLSEQVSSAGDKPDFTYLSLDLRDYDQALRAIDGCDAVVLLAACRGPGDYVVNTHNTYVAQCRPSSSDY